jgi:hypothetical protein
MAVQLSLFLQDLALHAAPLGLKRLLGKFCSGQGTAMQ